MGYYEDDEYYNHYFKEENNTESVRILEEGLWEDALIEVIQSVGLTSENRPKYSGNMEKLVFMYGDDREVYSPAEIRFIESVDDVIVFPDFTKSLFHGEMVCRVIAARLSVSGENAVKACVSFEKIVDKALDGFNIFLFLTEDSVFLGCRTFDKNSKRDCILSNSIKDEYEFEQILGELLFLTGIDSFRDYYIHYVTVITEEHSIDEDYEYMIMRKKGIQLSYIDSISNIESDMGLNMSKEKERYKHMFDERPQESFISLLEEVEESLSFIKSNRVNTYEILYEADEMFRQAEETEAENLKLSLQEANNASYQTASEYDDEAEALLDDPEEMIKLLKRRRGI